MSNVKDFLKRKDIVITPQRYLIEALGAMAQGLFASLLIGTIIKTLGQQTGLETLVDLGGYATAMSGPAMAVAIGWALHCPPLVLFSLVTVGYSSNALGGAGGTVVVGGAIELQDMTVNGTVTDQDTLHEGCLLYTSDAADEL